MKWSESHSVVSDSLCPHGLYSPWNSPGQSTGAGSLSLLQGIFPAQGWNPGLPHCKWILYQLRHKGSPQNSTWKHQEQISINCGWLFQAMYKILATFVWENSPITGQLKPASIFTSGRGNCSCLVDRKADWHPGCETLILVPRVLREPAISDPSKSCCRVRGETEQDLWVPHLANAC